MAEAAAADSEQEQDELEPLPPTTQTFDIFLTNVCSLFEYRTFVPDQTIVAPADEADSLIIIVDGKVVVSFDHPIIFSEPVELKHGDAIGDYAILGALL